MKNKEFSLRVLEQYIQIEHIKVKDFEHFYSLCARDIDVNDNFRNSNFYKLYITDEKIKMLRKDRVFDIKTYVLDKSFVLAFALDAALVLQMAIENNEIPRNILDEIREFSISNL